MFHLIVSFEPARREHSADGAITAARNALVARHFDGIYLAGYAGGKVGFLSAEFQALMLEIWKVKFLQSPALRRGDSFDQRNAPRSFSERWRFAGYSDSGLCALSQSDTRDGDGKDPMTDYTA